MKTFIHEIGIIDNQGAKHPVIFKEGLNVITGKSSTGKSAVIEIFDYCFASDENTIPIGVITDNAATYYTCIEINDECLLIGRDPKNSKKAFYKSGIVYGQDELNALIFDSKHFIPLTDFKKLLRTHFMDIDDVDTSLNIKNYRGRKSPTPSVRSLASFMLQHQNLVANKHALFYRFDEKEKREQVIDHVKIFLGLVDQDYFHLSQEKERLENEEKAIKLELDRAKKVQEKQKSEIEPIYLSLCADMGLERPPIDINKILLHPQNAREILNREINPLKVNPLSDALVVRERELENEISQKASELRKLQRKAGSIVKSQTQEKTFASTMSMSSETSIEVGSTICPFCRTENEQLVKSAELFSQALKKLSTDLQHSKSLKAKLSSVLLETERSMAVLRNEISQRNAQLSEIKTRENKLGVSKNIYENILTQKTKLDLLIESLATPLEDENASRLSAIKNELTEIKRKLSAYDFKKGLENANIRVNTLMGEIGSKFEFEESYKPINLHFSFETFDLYHLDQSGNKIYLRSMGSGANWLYCHVTLFLSLHKYFAELGSKCAIPSVIFFDQPTQVYFPSFSFDKEDEFSKENISTLEKRDLNDRKVDDDITAVENLFSQLSIFCTSVGKETGITPQIIVSDHADNLNLSDKTLFEKHVNGNRWRKRGLIHPVPVKSNDQ